MIKRLREAKLFWSTLITIVAIGILVALGNWQWARLHWKERLLQDLAAAEKAEPIPMRALPGKGISVTDEDLAALRFRRIKIEGRFDHANEVHIWQPTPSGPTWSVVTPLRLQPSASQAAGPGKKQATHILVIRGVVPDAAKSPKKRPDGQVTGRQSIVGRIRLDEPNTWANEPNIERNEWFTRDLQLVDQRLRAQASSAITLAPFFLEAESSIGGPSAPQPELKALTLSNRHLEYALTWWALAATLVGVFGAYVWSRLRPPKE